MYPRPYAHYTLLERLAVGGMSEVDLACRTVDDSGYVRFLAVKRIRAEKTTDQSFIRMFQDEARITSALRHTHIAQVYDFGKVGDEYYLALEYVPGLNLRDMINHEAKNNRLIPPKITLRILIDVLDALHYAHTRCDDLGQPMLIVHRDANPRNIMVSTSGETKLIDFGVARATDRLERTRTNHFKGKVAYMAPEQVKGRDVDHRADIFAIGLTLFELVTGRGAFRGLDQMQIMYRLIQDRVPSLTADGPYQAISKEIAAVFSKATAHDQAQRYATAEDMRAALLSLGQGAFQPATPDEMLSYLNQLDPHLKERVQEKIRSYSDTGSYSRASSPLPPPLEDASLTLDNTNVQRNTGASRAPLILAGALGTATLTLAAAGMGLLAMVIALVIWKPWLEPPEVETSPTVTTLTQEPAPPTPAPVVETESVNPEPVKTSGRGRARSRSRTKQEQTKNDPVKVNPEPTETRPEVAVEPVAVEPVTVAPVIIPSEPLAPSTEAPPVPEDSQATGTLQIASDPKNRMIWLNNQKTKYTTPARIDWPTGTIEVRVEGFTTNKTIVLRKDARKVVRFP
jgi:serine/threonine protein kinase